MMRTIVIAAFLCLAAAGAASAQGTPQQRAACENDANRLCAQAIPDAIAVERCLRAYSRYLSPACKREMRGATGRRRR
jgi:hypothetical protein